MSEREDMPGPAFDSVWDALEDRPAEAANMRLRSELMNAIRDVVAGWSVAPATAARRLGVTQPRLDELTRGKINSFSLDALAALADSAGLDVRMQVRPVAA